MKKTNPRPKLTVPRPFSTRMVEINFENSAKLSVHRAYWHKNPRLVDMTHRSHIYSTEQCDIKDVSVDVGHVLVNWLYTGTYQALNRGPSSGPNPQQALKTAFGVFSLAGQFDLPELYSLAAHELSQLKTRIDLGSFIEAIRDVYPQTLGKDPWIQSFIAEYIKDAMNNAKTTPPAAEPEAEDQDMTVVKLTVKGLLDACGKAMRNVAAREAALAEGGNVTAPQSSMEDGRASTEAETTAPDSNDWVMPSPQPSKQLEARLDLVEKVKKPKSLKAKKKKREPLAEPEPEPESEAGAALLQESEPIPEHPVSEHVPEIPGGFAEDPEITAIKKEKKAKLKERKAKKKRLALALQAELEQRGQGDMPEQDLEPAPKPEVVQLGPVHVVVEDGPSEFPKVKKPEKKKKETSVPGEVAEEKVEEEVVIFTAVHDWDR